MAQGLLRSKSLKVVIGFASLDDAMALEECAKEHGIPGRIIPVPAEVSAGCGLAWMAPGEQKELVLQGILEHGLAYQGIFEVMMY